MMLVTDGGGCDDARDRWGDGYDDDCDRSASQHMTLNNINDQLPTEPPP